MHAAVLGDKVIGRYLSPVSDRVKGLANVPADGPAWGGHGE